MASKLKVNSITNRNEDGPVDFPDGIQNQGVNVPEMSNGQWTPTITPTAGATVDTLRTFRYSRQGDIVTITGRFEITSTSSGGIEFNTTLPIAPATAFDATRDNATGTATFNRPGAGSSFAGYVESRPSNDELIIRIDGLSNASYSVLFCAQYNVN